MKNAVVSKKNGHLTLTKSLVTDGVSRAGVSLKITSHLDTPAIVAFADSPPGEYRVVSVETNSVEGTGWRSVADGSLEGSASIPSGRTVTFTYALIDPHDPDNDLRDIEIDLPDPEITEVVPITSEQSLTSLAVSWRRADGEQVPLVIRDSDTYPTVENTNQIGEGLIEGPQRRFSEQATDFETTDRTIILPEELPALGILVRDDNADAVFGTVLRAREYGLSVFLIHYGSPNSEIVRLSRQLGAEIVPPPQTRSQVVLKRTLARAARDAGHPGIIFQRPGCPRIDYPKSLAAFENAGFEVTAIAETESDFVEASDVVVGIPAYNAEATIGAVVRAAEPFADLVLVVDDGSADETAVRARENGAVVIVHERNRGYGGALKTLFREANERAAQHLVTLDADGQHDPADIPKLISHQENAGADIVIGSRYVAGSETHVPFARSIGLGIINMLTNLSMGRITPRSWVRDTQSGFRAYSSWVLSTLVATEDIGDGMWASTDIIYAANTASAKFAEVGTTITYDVESGSTEGALSHGTGLLWNIIGFAERTHPLLLLGLPGFIGVLIGMLFGSWGLHLVLTNEPSLFVILATTLCLVIGIGLIFLSLMYHVMNTHPLFRRQKSV